MRAAPSGGQSDRHVVFPDLAPRRGAFDFAPSPQPRSARTAVGPTPDEASFLRGLLIQVELDARDYCDATLKRRLPACLRSVGAGTIAQARVLLRRRPEAVLHAVNALTIGVTSFFRDPAVFKDLRSDVLRPLVDTGRRLTICSVGCSNGAELYSIAILLDQFDVLHRARLLGLDCRGDAIARAEAGRFDSADVDALAPDVVERYFERRGDDLRIHAGLRAAARWRRANVLRAALDGPFDLIACRNMAIYLQGPARCRLWRRLAAALRPGGVLMVGKAERPALPELEPMRPCLYQKTA
jgi:chemotaxis methyl-accepting protein methylase